jgi:ATP-dependent DNA ligase
MPAQNIPFPPMEAELVRELPKGEGWQYEPKWDGFRGVLENAGEELALWSRKERPLLRYFPELRPLGDLLPPNSALDGEIVIARDGALDFDAMQTRLHPAESRIRKLSTEIPADYVVFDMLVWDGEPVWQLPLRERRARVEALEGFRISPATQDIAGARAWMERFEALGLDGVIGKRLDLPYAPGSREAVVKIKEHRTADCVVVGVRWKGGDRTAVATLLLGLYREDGGLDYVGSCVVGARMRAEVVARVLPLLDESSDRRFSEPNRWGTGELEESAVSPEVVVEVRYDKVQGPRFRHGTKFIRWREDKDPASCTWRELRPAKSKESVEALFA